MPRIHIRLEITHSHEYNYGTIHESMNTIGAYRFYFGSDGVLRDLPPAEYRVYNSAVTIENVEQRIRAALSWIPSCDIHIEAEEVGRTIGFNLKRSSFEEFLLSVPVNSTCTIPLSSNNTAPVPSDDFFESMLATYPSVNYLSILSGDPSKNR